MEKRKNSLYLFYLFTYFFYLNHIIEVKAQNDSAVVFSLKDLYASMREHHPLVKAIRQKPIIAQQELLVAKGNFDPKLNVDYSQKSLKDKFYYSYWDSHLKIPSWIGELKAGYELNEGALLSEDSKTPEQGLLYAGISVPLGQNLLIDARRASLKQARIAIQLSEAEQTKELNKLFLQASKDYWEWYLKYNELILSKLAYDLAQKRFDFIKQRIAFGEAAGIDSVEAKITFQERSIQLQQSQVSFNNTTLLISNYLWKDDTPMLLPEGAIPQQAEGLSQSNLNELLEFAQKNHPELQKIRFKMAQLDIERRFRADRLKPSVNLSYNLLSPYQNFSVNEASFNKNYKIGVQADFPLFLRKERGKLKQVGLKQQQNNWELSQNQREIETELKRIFNELQLLEQNIALQREIVDNQDKMRKA
ncbi:MAG: TolC family protein, partial [Thermonemataceae bacterium]|nr:TolC family protein [Thermonemataceae bacterium]